MTRPLRIHWESQSNRLIQQPSKLPWTKLSTKKLLYRPTVTLCPLKKHGLLNGMCRILSWDN